MTTDDLAGILREHGQLGMARQGDGSFLWECICGEKLPEDLELVEDAHYAHVAAVIAAAGWTRWPELTPRKTWYRSLYGNGRVWCESRDPDEVRERSEGKDCTFERYDIYEVTEGWQPWEA